MSTPNTGTSNTVVTCVLAGGLDDEHLGRQVAFYNTAGHRVNGVLRSVHHRGFTACVLTLDGDRHWFISPTTEVDVITQAATA